MNRYPGRLLILVLATSLTALSACKKPAPPPAEQAALNPPAEPALSVTTLELGNRVGYDKRVVQPMGVFGKRDTVYVSVLTQGSAATATLSARWTYQDGQLVNEGTEAIAPTGPAATEFHISKASPWPLGKYKVEVSLNGTPVGTREFEVK